MNKSKYEIRAKFDQKAISVYQAFSPSIATPALKHQKLVSPFAYDRMTWVKPSFLWMMYRSDWGQRAGQEKILEIKIKREYWEKALVEAILTTPEKHVYNDAKKWRKQLQKSNIRVQWDPERDIQNKRLHYKSIQVGITAKLAEEYAKKWIVSIEDKTPLVKEIYQKVLAGQWQKAEKQLPVERNYPLPQEIKTILGM